MIDKIFNKTQSIHVHVSFFVSHSHRYQPGVMIDTYIHDIISMIVVFVCSYGYLQNPYLAAKLVEIMYVINPAVQPNTTKLNETLLNHSLAVRHLVPALMSFYTGRWHLIGSAPCHLITSQVICYLSNVG